MVLESKLRTHTLSMASGCHPLAEGTPGTALQVISEVFCWTRDPTSVRRLVQRKEEILSELLGESKPMIPAGVMQLLDTLQKNSVRREEGVASLWGRSRRPLGHWGRRLSAPACTAAAVAWLCF